MLYRYFVSRIPYGPGAHIRQRFLKAHLAHLGDNSIVSDHVKIISYKNVWIGSNVSVANQVILDGRGGLYLGDGCLIGFQTIFITCTHKSEQLDLPVHHQGFYSKPITVGKNTWLGARCTILPGVTIGDSAIIAAGSVITKDIPPGVVAAGVPCRVISQRRKPKT
jgi:acetyltransferase-like isoleucine patch superfamily enzyme